MKKFQKPILKEVSQGWKKLTNVKVPMGRTALPTSPKKMEPVGVRFDFAGEIEKDKQLFNKYKIQPNAGKVSSSIREWRDKNGGTHGVMTEIDIKKDGG